MKHHIIIPLLTLCAAFSATAQKQPMLKDIRNVSLPQLMKQKKDIRFIPIPASRGTTIRWYKESKPAPQQQEVVTQPSADANGNIKAQQKTNAFKGTNTTLINVGNWHTGVYLVKLYNAAGDVVSLRVFK